MPKEDFINCILMNKNTPVISLKGINTTISDKVCFPTFHADSMDYINKKLSPPCIWEDNEGLRLSQLNHWFLKRGVSAKRIGLPDKDRVKWDDGLPHYFSLSDQYWIKYSETESWDKLNFFNNPYSMLTGDVIFSKNLESVDTILLQYDSPDITTNGVLKKRWSKDKFGNNILIKHMSKEFAQEPMNEILASKLLSKLKLINFVSYKLYIEGYDLCCACKDFITPNTEFVPAKFIYSAVPFTEDELRLDKTSRVYPHLIKAVEYFEIPGAKEFIDSMIVADRIMFNMDRHLGNFGFIRNVDTGDYIESAPLFDFGNAFFPNSTNMENKFFSKREEYLFHNAKIKPLDLGSFREIIDAYAFIDEDQKSIIMNSLNKNNEYIEKKLNSSYRHESKDNIQHARIDIN